MLFFRVVSHNDDVIVDIWAQGELQELQPNKFSPQRRFMVQGLIIKEHPDFEVTVDGDYITVVFKDRSR